MKRTFLLLLLSGPPAGPTQSVDLVAAVAAQQVGLSVTAAGGLGEANLRCRVRNLGRAPLRLMVPAGLRFEAADPNAQDLLTTEPQVVLLAAQEEKEVLLHGFCTEASHYSPSVDAAFTFRGYAPLALKTLADSLGAYPALAHDYGQMFVWALTDGRALYDIDAEAAHLRPARNLLRYVRAEAAKRPTNAQKPGRTARVRLRRPEGNAGPSVKLFSKKGFLVYPLPKAQALSLKVYDGAGNEEFVLFENRQVPAGALHFGFGLNEIVPVETQPVYFFKLLDAAGRVLTQVQVDEHTVERDITPQRRSFTFSVQLAKAAKNAAFTVRLPDGTLVEQFKPQPYMPPGTLKTHLTFDHLYGPQAAFVAQLETPTGQVLARQPLGAE